MEEKVYHSNFKVESNYWWFTARAHIVSSLIERYCELATGDTVVDIGCGTGGFLELLSKKYHAIGTDTSALALEYCRKRGMNDLHLGTLDDFPKDKWQVKAVTMLDVLEHIENDNAVATQVFDLLQPGGYFIATVPAYQWMWSAHDVMHMHYRRYTKSSLNALLTQTGFQPIKLSYFNSFLFPLAALKRMSQKGMQASDIKSVVDPVPDSLNYLFDKIFRSELALLKNISLPFGVSLIAICRKAL